MKSAYKRSYPSRRQLTHAFFDGPKPSFGSHKDDDSMTSRRCVCRNTIAPPVFKNVRATVRDLSVRASRVKDACVRAVLKRRACEPC